MYSGFSALTTTLAPCAAWISAGVSAASQRTARTRGVVDERVRQGLAGLRANLPAGIGERRDEHLADAAGGAKNQNGDHGAGSGWMTMAPLFEEVERCTIDAIAYWSFISE